MPQKGVRGPGWGSEGGDDLPRKGELGREDPRVVPLQDSGNKGVRGTHRLGVQRGGHMGVTQGGATGNKKRRQT